MTGLDFLKHIVEVWNNLEKPTSTRFVKKAVAKIIKEFKKIPISGKGFSYADCSDVLCDFDDPDQHLIGFMIKEIGVGLKLPYLLFISYFTEGLVYLDYENNPVAALNSYKQADGLWFDDLSEQYYLGNISLAYIDLSQWESAIMRLIRAIEIAESRGDKESIGIYFQNLGVAYRGKGKLYDALDCYKIAHKIAQDLNDSNSIIVRGKNLEAIKEDIWKFENGFGTKNYKIKVEEKTHRPEIKEASGRALQLNPGDTFLEKYEVCKVMKGRMGIVYLLKNINREGGSDPEFLCAKTFFPKYLPSEEVKRLFIKEVENWMLLGRYEHIAWAYSYIEVGNQPFVFTQYCDSGSLGDLIKNGFNPGNSDEDFVHAVIWASGITLGMRHIYNTINSPHGDLSLNNILFSESGGLPKIADFGIMSVVKKSKKWVKQDIMQYGMILWHLFTGEQKIEPDKITDNINRYNWIAEPIRDLIINSINSPSNDGKLYFRMAFRQLDDYFYDSFGMHLTTPEKYHSEISERIKIILVENFGAKIESIETTGPEPVSSYINRAAALLDIDSIDRAFEILLEVLQMLRHRKDSDEAIVAWKNLKLLFSKIPDINRRSIYIQQALRFWQ